MNDFGKLLFAFGVAILYDRGERKRREIELIPTEIPDMSMNLDESDYVILDANASEQDLQDVIAAMSNTVDDVPEEVPMALEHVSTQHFRIFDIDGDKIIAPSWQWGHIQRDREKFHAMIGTIQLLSCGGATVVTLWNDETDSLHTGVAVCHPEEHFSRRMGRIKAYGQAVSAATRGVRVRMGEKQSSLAKVCLELAAPNNKGAMIPLKD